MIVGLVPWDKGEIFMINKAHFAADACAGPNKGIVILPRKLSIFVNYGLQI